MKPKRAENGHFGKSETGSRLKSSVCLVKARLHFRPDTDMECMMQSTVTRHGLKAHTTSGEKLPSRKDGVRNENYIFGVDSVVMRVRPAATRGL